MKRKLLLLSLISMSSFGFGQTLLNEEFNEDIIPAGFSVQQFNQLQTWTASAGFAGVDYDEELNDQNEWLITPSLDFSANNLHYYLSFDAFLSYTWGVTYNNYDLLVKVSTDNGATWSTIWSEAELPEWNDYDDVNRVNLDVSQYANNPNVKFAFQYIGNDGAGAYLDTVQVLAFAEQPTAPECAILVSPENGETDVEFNPDVLFSWSPSATGSQSTSYDLLLGDSPATLQNLGSLSASAVRLGGASANTTYFWSVIPKNTFGQAAGCEVFSFTTGAGPFAPYCGPIDFPYVEPITNVTFAGINNTTDAESDEGHEIFLDQVAQVTPGETYPITVKGTTEGDYFNKIHVYVDWNQNGTFDESEIYSIENRLNNSTGVDDVSVTTNITVPADAVAGETRLRVKKEFVYNSNLTGNNNPCADTSTFGQAEDYTVNVGSLSISDTSKSIIRAYPNPVVDYLTITSMKNTKSVKVVDITGRVVIHSTKAVKENKIDMSSLTPGTYIVTVETEDGVKTFKSIKK